jgi:hypothetical protein
VEEHPPALVKREQHSLWRPAGVGIASLGTPAIIGIVHPVFGGVVVIVEAVVVLAIVLTALYASEARSERAFRLLRWLGNRPEPPNPDTRPPVKP